MENVPPPAVELSTLDRELARLEARRAQLLARRAQLLSMPYDGFGPPAPVPVRRPATAVGPRGGPEATPTSVQNVLLALGGVLLAVAAVAFTLVSWGRLGIGGRGAVLGLVTAAALAAPAALLRRRLASTAESVAAIALVLTVLDAYALHRVVFTGVEGRVFWALAAAVLAAVWAAYGLALGRLRVPLPAAVLAVQWPLPLWAWSAGSGGPGLEWALLVTAVLDVVLAAGAGRAVPSAVRVVAAVGAGLTGCWALLIAGVQSVTADSAAAAVRPGALLFTAAGVLVWAARRLPGAAAGLAAGAGLLAVVGAGGVVRAATPDGWSVLGYALCAAAVSGAVRAGARSGRAGPVAQGLSYAAVSAAGGAVLCTLPLLLAGALLGPAARLEGVWSGPTAAAYSAGGLVPAEPGGLSAALILLAGAAVLWQWPGAPGGRAGGAAALVWSAGMVLPVGFGAGYGAGVAWVLAVTCAVVLVAVRGTGWPGLAEVSTACALAGGASAVLAGLATRTATFAVLGVLVAVFCLGVLLVPSGAGRAVQAVFACTATVCAAGLVGAGAAAAGLAAHQAAVALLAVPAAAALAAARLGRRPVTVPLEVTGAAAGLTAVGLAAGDAMWLGGVLALCGVIAGGTALRAERRPGAGYASAALLTAATWAWLAAADVTVPEAYTASVSVAVLAVGVLRRRGDAEASSWSAYGPGLAVTLVPSLAAAWGEGHWLRPLLLGVAALAVTLAGARLRLQAPLVLGGAVLAAVALHELMPYAVQAVGVLPRWLPPALAGLALLAMGATYEQRLREARRLRAALGRMR
ncbi:SCO7613 C-terminal domain-containing membrane protein [Streptomyces sp. MUM 178J]|uniref:SCO7613 C-terminal domain-containing membrane protein n=1 Tax=Streptomyces sp. MUM 178J TaxID=2791991 RepID=UPI002E7B075B|nr:hypothetical protein [Streptomyces sp. MUM 178J]WRQ78525.1 hypothetical protein I3F59_003500 [Streptomyces sp. MUM 178J]